MEQVIKFRALKDDMSNCIFMYGQLVYDAIGQPRITEIDSSGKGLTFHTCLKGTEGQFTGLLDKHGKEIYCGDIVLANGSKYVKDFDMSGARKFVSSTISDIGHSENVRSKYEVYWQNCFAQFGFKSLENHSINAEVSSRELEIIGNIHQNSK